MSLPPPRKGGPCLCRAPPDLLTPVSIRQERLRSAAAEGDRATLGELLLLHGTAGFVNRAAGQSGRTALMAAASGGHLACIAMLLAAGADTAQTDSDGRTALQLVARANSDEARALLRSAPPTEARAAAWAAQERRQAALDEAVEAAEAVAEAARRAALLAVEQGVRGSPPRRAFVLCAGQ